MAPTLRGIGSNGAALTADITVTTSASAVDGDLILIVTDVNTSAAFPTPTCTGFTHLANSPNSTYNRISLLGLLIGFTIVQGI